MTEPVMTEEMEMSEENAMNLKGMIHRNILKVKKEQ